jgi:hypothetical protein
VRARVCPYRERAGEVGGEVGLRSARGEAVLRAQRLQLQALHPREIHSPAPHPPGKETEIVHWRAPGSGLVCSPEARRRSMAFGVGNAEHEAMQSTKLSIRPSD